MIFSCPICSERLDRNPAERANNTNPNDDINISSTPCGHIFHTYCIQRWLTGNLGSSKQCPNCRKPVPGLKVLPLFPDTYSPSDDSIIQIEGGGSCDHTHFNEQIQTLKQRLEKSQDDLSNLNMILDVERSNSIDYKKRYDNEKLRSDKYMFQFKQAESYKTYSDQKERECNELELQLKKFQMIESLVRNVQDEVSYELGNYPVTKESIKTLLETQSILKREFELSASKLTHTKKQQETERLEMSNLKQKYSIMKKELEELRSVHNLSADDDKTPNRSLQKTDVHQMMHYSRTPLYHASTTMLPRKKFAQPDGDGIDQDVPIINGFGKNKKQKSTSKSQEPKTKKSKLEQQSNNSDNTEFSTLRPKVHSKGKSFSPNNLLDFDDDTTDIDLTDDTPKASSSKLNSQKLKTSNLKKINRELNSNKTIILSDSDEDVPLRSNIPGMHITPQTRKEGKKQFKNSTTGWIETSSNMPKFNSNVVYGQFSKQKR